MNRCLARGLAIASTQRTGVFGGCAYAVETCCLFRLAKHWCGSLLCCQTYIVRCTEAPGFDVFQCFKCFVTHCQTVMYAGEAIAGS